MDNYWAQWSLEELMDMQGCNDTNCAELHNEHAAYDREYHSETSMESLGMSNADFM